jgi:hypothetical protein
MSGRGYPIYVAPSIPPADYRIVRLTTDKLTETIESRSMYLSHRR